MHPLLKKKKKDMDKSPFRKHDVSTHMNTMLMYCASDNIISFHTRLVRFSEKWMLFWGTVGAPMLRYFHSSEIFIFCVGCLVRFKA